MSHLKMFILLLITTFIAYTNANPMKPYSYIPERSLKPRIVNGEDAQIQDYPYQVSVQTPIGHLCGGSIISENHILTTASCVILANVPLTIRAGSSFHGRGGSIHNVESIIVHDDWYKTADMAILKVKESFELDSTRKIVPLFEDKNFPTGLDAQFSGWGLTSESSLNIPEQLKSVKLYMTDHDWCNRVSDNPNMEKLVEGQFCASIGYLKVFACYGDTGGPLVYKGKQIGIFSKNYGCERKNYPGVFTDVHYYREWIKEKIVV